MRRPIARPALVGVLALTGALAGCSAPTRPTPSPTPLPAVRFATGGAAAAAAPDAVDRAIEVSRALFVASPGVVLAPDRDGPAQRAAAVVARRLHIPVLLAPAPPPGGASAPPSASPTRAPGTGAVAVVDEVRRLGARWVAISGRTELPGLHARRIPLDRADRERLRVPALATGTAVASGTGADTAALATAEAAGLGVADAPGADPWSSAATVHAASGGRRVLLVGSRFAGVDAAWAVRAAGSGFQYPGGGQRPFDGHRLFIALYGTPGTGELGVLGAQGPAATIQRVQGLAAQYRRLVRRTVVPSLEIIATIASGSPTDDGDYSSEVSPGVLEPYLDAAHAAHIPVILDLQPGRTDFLTQAKEYSSLLGRPDVGLALDPEWRLGPHQVPLVQIGSVSAAEVNRVSSWLSGLVRAKGLPPKMFVLHEFRLSMLPDRSRIDVSHPELDTLIHVDGQGTQPDKQATWDAVRAGAPSVAWGWKNFLQKDRPVLTPAQTIDQVHPTPDLITYQ